jgi:light-regulated signal transduction histidine kinase (bacteriophytochrome)
VDNILTGIVVGLMVLLYERRRQRDVEKKLRTIRLMNHHVRNALQVISAASDSLNGSVQPSTVQSAVRRIEWALREVLPGESELTDAAVPPNPETPKNGSAA